MFFINLILKSELVYHPIKTSTNKKKWGEYNMAVLSDLVYSQFKMR